MNMMGVLLHVIGDFLGSLGVLVSGLIIKYTKGDIRYYGDPIASVLIVLIILGSSIPLCKKCIKILMHMVPANIDVQQIRKRIMSIKGIVNVHHLHIWRHNNNIIIGTLHLVIGRRHCTEEIMGEIERLFHEYNVHATTIQLEIHPGDGSSDICSNHICASDNCKNMCCHDY